MAKKTIKNRKEFQNSESYAVEKTGLPETRFNETAQIATAPETKSTADVVRGNVAPDLAGTTASAAVAVKKKMSIRPVSEATLAEGKQVGGVPLDSTGTRANVAGALSNVNPAVDESKIPYNKGEYRPITRYGKKNSTDNFVINNTISEQIEPVVEESKDLRESPNEVQGYNGVKQFKTARGKKNAGTTPASFLFDRSIDFVEHSSIVHTTGQVIDTITSKSDYPTQTSTTANNTASILNPMKKANYLLKGLKFDIVDGHIRNVSFDETCYITNGQGTAIEQANQNWQIDANNVAKTMVKLQTELGRETTDKWSPLGYVINQPYEYNMLMHDIEATTGAVMAAAYRSSAHSLAYQINKLGKDGAKGVTPIYEMMYGSIADCLSSDDFDGITGNVEDNVWDSEYLKKGSPAAIIKMFDSVKKYQTKADFFNQQRSFKFHLQNVDNNINPLHCKPEFLKALDKESVFSTEDGNYNPMLPIHLTKDIKLMNPLSLNYFLQGWTNPIVDTTNENRDCGTKNVYSYAYKDIRFQYVWGVRHPLVDGLIRWMLRHEANIVNAYGNNVEEIYWPANFSTTYPSMMAYAFCSAAQDILWMRNVIFRDALFAGEQSSYLWDDLGSLSEYNPIKATQYVYTDYGSGLKLGKLAVDKAIRIYWPEHIGYKYNKNADATLDGAAYYLPWYYNENAIGVPQVGYGYFTTNTPNVISMPSLRGGVNHFACDLLYGVTERDVRLALDRMVDLPQCSTIVGKGEYIYSANTQYKAIAPTIIGRAGLSKYNIPSDTISKLADTKFAAIRYDKVSDGRVLMIMQGSTNAGANDWNYLREDTVLTTPRELGYIFPMPASMRKYSSTYFSNPEDIYGTRNEHWPIDGSSSVSMICYQANGTDLSEQSISRTAALSQHWNRICASRIPEVVENNINAINTVGIVPAIGAFIDGANGTTTPTLDTAVVFKDAFYALDSAQLSSDIDSAKLVSLSSFLWTMLQRYYSPINLFDCAYEANVVNDSKSKPTPAPAVDPLESAIYFGFCGCLASDFNQDILERLNIKDELGMYYTTDEFIKSSLIFKA